MAKFSSKFEILGIDKLSTPFRNIAKENGELRKAFKKTQTSLHDLQGKTSKIDAFHKHLNISKKLKSEREQARQKLDELTKAYNNAEKPTYSMKLAIKKAAKEVDRLATKQAEATKKVTKVSSSLKELGINVKHVGKHTFDLRQEEKQLNTELETTKNKLDKVAVAHKKVEQARRKREKAEQSASAMAIVGETAKKQGSSILRTASQPIGTAISFEAQMSKVGAKVSGAEKGSQGFMDMEKIAMDLGSSTAFSASEVAQSIELLGMAGTDVENINEKMVSGLLDIAKAGSISLEDATSLSTSVIKGFGLDIKNDMKSVGDILAYTANNANTNLTEMAEIFKAVSPVAKTAGVDLKQVSGMIGVLADVGVKSSIAGTAIKNTLLNLSSPAASGAKALRKLGIETKDSLGNLRPLTEVFSEIAEQTSEMGNAERASIYESIGGREAIAGFAALVDKAGTKEGVEELLKIEKNMDKVDGYAKKLGKSLSNNLDGDLTSLSSHFDGLSIIVGKMFIPALRSITKGITSVVKGLSWTAKTFPTLTKGILGATAVFGGLMIAGGTLATTLAAIKIAAAAVSFNMTLMGAKTGLSLAAISSKFVMLKASSAVAYTSLLTGIKTSTIAFGLWVKSTVLGLASIRTAIMATGIGAAIVALGLGAAYVVKNWDKVKSYFKSFWDSIKPIWSSVVTWFKDIFAPITYIYDKLFGSSDNKKLTINKESVTKTVKQKIDSFGDSRKPSSAIDKNSFIMNPVVNINIADGGDPNKIARVVKTELENFVDGMRDKHEGRFAD